LAFVLKGDLGLLQYMRLGAMLCCLETLEPEMAAEIFD
jgi:hypothetical protein